MFSFVLKLKDWLLNFWLQPYMWTACFFAWYQLYCTTFVGLLISCSWYTSILLFIVFEAFWLLSVCSLYKCLYTRPPLIPHNYLVPQKVFDLLTTRDRQDFRESDTNLSSSCSSNNSSDNDELVEFKPKRRKRSQWERFYRELTDLAANRNLNVRRMPITFYKETIQCPTVCTRCQIVKPDRTHHCRRCKTCVIRMDHHCPAIGRCVHLTNHKYFLIFLLYATLLCLYAFVTMLPFLINAFMRFYELRRPKHGSHHDIFTIPFTFSAMGCIQTLVFPIVLIWFQWSLWQDVMKNQTTLEDMEFDLHDSPKPTSKYNLGSRRKNMESIFGTNKWKWFLPIQSTNIGI